MADCKKHVLSKVVKNIIFQNKTLLVMFYKHNKTFWYQSCNFKHFLKAENSEDSLASSCVEFSIGLSCNPVWDGLLLELVSPKAVYSVLFYSAFTPSLVGNIAAVACYIATQNT